MNDEQAIRELVATWHKATAKGDFAAILKLMAEDVVFLVAGQPPMRGREAFASSFKEVLKLGRLETSGDIQEIQVNEQFAYCWTHLSITMIPTPDHRTIVRENTLTIFRKQADVAWVLFRDANLLSEKPE
ncbi:MAG: SgcJ/EcaC family oxidoreductase [Acidobacteriota bacterium]